LVAISPRKHFRREFAKLYAGQVNDFAGMIYINANQVAILIKVQHYTGGNLL